MQNDVILINFNIFIFLYSYIKMSTPVGNFESYPPPLSTVPSSAIEMEATRIWSNYYSGFKWMWWLLFIMILTALIIFNSGFVLPQKH